MAEKRQRDVNYDIDVVQDDFPETGMGERRSPLRDKLAEIEANPEKHNKAFILATYGAKGGAASAAGNLRKTLKDKGKAGWTFKPAAYETDDGSSRTALWAKYVPVVAEKPKEVVKKAS